MGANRLGEEMVWGRNDPDSPGVACVNWASAHDPLLSHYIFLKVIERRKGPIMMFVISVKHNNNDIFGVRMWFVACKILSDLGDLGVCGNSMDPQNSKGQNIHITSSSYKINIIS